MESWIMSRDGRATSKEEWRREPSVYGMTLLMLYLNHPYILTTLCSQIYTRQRYCGSLIKHTYVQVIRWNLYTLPSVEQ